jgi:hypothetical protein
LQAVIKGLSKVTGAPLEIGKNPISVFPSNDLETRLKELIKIHPALRQRKFEWGRPDSNHAVNRFHRHSCRSPEPPLPGQDRHRL